MTMLHVESRQFQATAPEFKLPHLHLAPLLGVTLFEALFGVTLIEFCQDFRHQKMIPWAIVWHWLSDPTFSYFSKNRLVTDGQTDT